MSISDENRKHLLKISLSSYSDWTKLPDESFHFETKRRIDEWIILNRSLQNTSVTMNVHERMIIVTVSRINESLRNTQRTRNYNRNTCSFHLFLCQFSYLSISLPPCTRNIRMCFRIVECIHSIWCLASVPRMNARNSEFPSGHPSPRNEKGKRRKVSLCYNILSNFLAVLVIDSLIVWKADAGNSSRSVLHQGHVFLRYFLSLLLRLIAKNDSRYLGKKICRFDRLISHSFVAFFLFLL